MTRRRTIAGIAVFVVLVAAAAGFFGRTRTGVAADASAVPTARVVRGPLDLSIHTTGNLRASKSMLIQAPSVAGGTLRLVTMADSGTAVHTGDVIMEFDPSEQQYALEQAQSELEEAEQQIAKSRADLDVQTAQARVDLLTAEFDVRRAELDAKIDKDLIAANEHQTRQLSLEEAKRKLAQLSDATTSRAETTRATLAVAEESRTRAKMAAERARQNIESLVVKAPIDGFLVARENRDASGGVYYSGMSLPAYRAGDTVYPGRPVADIFDVSAMEIRAKVNEQQRNNVAVGQTAVVTSNALPTVTLAAKVTSVSGLAQSDWWGTSGPLRDFDMTLGLDQGSARVLPGTSVRLVVAGTHVNEALHIPRQAVFEREGKPIVYVRTGSGFEPRPVKATHRTEGRVAIEGLKEGDEVALVNPETAAKAAPKTASPAAGAPR
jgi:multidrug resistance efflux pump